MISANLAAIFYLVSGVLFILALRGLSSPDTSRQGNYFGIAGMIIAIVVTFLAIGNISTSLIYVIIFLVIGGGGSIGQAITKELFKRSADVLHIVDLSENYLVELVLQVLLLLLHFQ